LFFKLELEIKKLVSSFKVIEEMKIISLCNLVDKVSSIEENYFDKSFLIDATLSSQDQFYRLWSLIDSDSAIYALVHIKLVDQICQKLEIQSISLAKEKLIQEYDDKLTKKIITHKILSNLIIEDHKELTVSMLIVDIDHHEIILEKSWMNKNDLLLDMRHDEIVFLNWLDKLISILSVSTKAKQSNWFRSSSSFINSVLKVLQWSAMMTQKKNFSMFSIAAASFHSLLKKSKKAKTEVFAMSMKDINRKIAYNTQCELNALNVASSTIDASAQNIEDIKIKLSLKYLDYLNVFDRAQIDKLPSHRSYDHKIELTNDAISSRCRAYWMSSVKLIKVKEYLNENLSKSYITSSQTSYSSSVLFALKANDDLRFCVDYRKLNVIIKRNRYSLSLIDEMIDKIIDCKHLTRLNIISTFNKLRMHLDSENYTTFIIALEVYKFKMLSFKLTNDSTSFQQYMNDVLWDFLNDFCQAYLDDILIYSKTQKKHRQHVRLILDRLQDADLQIDIRKCEFDVEETVFLKIIVSEQDLRMNSIKMKVIVNWATSINLKEMQSFVDFVNFYRRFIKNFSKLVKLFTQLTWKDTSFVWNEVCAEVFTNLKKQISSTSVLRHFDVKRQTILKTDAFNYVKSDILSQYDDENVLHSMTFYSKSMISAECNYHIYDKKLLVIIRCFEHWRLELETIELSIQMFTNHQALKTFMKNKQLIKRQANYLNILSKFNFQIIFRSGKMNDKVDALIRITVIDSSEFELSRDERFQIILISNRINVVSSKLDVLLIFSTSEYETNLYQHIRLVNQTDELCIEYQQVIVKDELILHEIKLKNCQIVNDVLFKKSLLWVLKKLYIELLQKIHDQSSISHFDIRRIIDLVQRFYYWSDHQATIRQYIWNCHVCQRSKILKDDTNDLLQPLSIFQQRWQDIAMNFITELFLSEGYNAICIIICRLFKDHHYVLCHWGDESISIEETIWIMLWNVYRLHELSSSIVSNRDFQFVSIMWQSLCKRLKIKINLSTIYHSETDEQSKRVNQNVERELRIYCNYMQNDWVKWLSMIEFSDNYNIFSVIAMSSFYFNKNFHSRMSFDSDTTDYEITRQRIETRKIDDIVIWMKKLLTFDR